MSDAGRRRNRTAFARGGQLSAWPVRRHLLLIGVTALVSLVVGSWYGFTWAGETARSEALAEITVQADRAAESLKSSVDIGKKTVEALATQPGLEAVFQNPDNNCTLTAGGAGPFPSLRLDIVSATGQTGCSSLKTPEVFATDVHAGSSWLTAGLAAKSINIDWQAVDAVTGDPAVAITAPVVAEGQAAGVIALLMHIPPAAVALAHDLAGTESASFTLIDQPSRTVLSTSLSGSASKVGERFTSEQPTGQWSGLDGTQRLFASRAAAGTNWRIYVGVPVDDVLAATRGGLFRGGAIGLAATLLLCAALVLLNRRVGAPLREVTAAVVEAGRDPSGKRVTPRGTAELVTLATEVNAMLDVRAGHEAQLVHQATHDPLTGLPNGVLLRDRLEQALRRDRNGARIAVFSLGIDRFRTLNDALGPDAADRILAELAERLSAAVRPGDTLARYGGDQFVVLSENIDIADHAVRVATRLLECLREPFHPSGDPVDVSCSVGVTLVRGHRDRPTAPQLLREADSAMHQAKAAGRGWSLSDQSQQVRASAYLQTEHALRQALENEELVVHYQPLVDVATGRVCAAEALVRWQHPTRGLVPPLEFIPVAEETGQIAAIGDFVLNQACAEAARWAAMGHPLSISVNVAVGQLRDPNYVGSVQRALAAAPLPPGRLCLEITESSIMRASGNETRVLEELQRLGVRLAIDDFGTGYSSLSYLHQLPVDELKIDRSFVNRIAAGTPDAHLVEAIVGMAHALGLEVVAEGVEAAEQLEFLADLGCERAQGYLFSPPVPAAQLRDQLMRSRSDPPPRDRSTQTVSGTAV